MLGPSIDPTCRAWQGGLRSPVHSLRWGDSSHSVEAIGGFVTAPVSVQVAQGLPVGEALLLRVVIKFHVGGLELKTSHSCQRPAKSFGMELLIIFCSSTGSFYNIRAEKNNIF